MAITDISVSEELMTNAPSIKYRGDEGPKSPQEMEKIITTIKNRKTGEVYKTEEALKAANIPEEDVQRDVRVIMPPLDLFGKTK